MQEFHAGAPGNGTPYRRLYDRPGTEGYTGFLESTHSKHGKFVMLPGNAPHHKSEAPKRFPKGMDGKIKICHFPPYAPEPEPAEAQWRAFRKAAWNRMYESVEEMPGSIDAVLREEETPVVKTYNYLARRPRRRFVRVWRIHWQCTATSKRGWCAIRPCAACDGFASALPWAVRKQFTHQPPSKQSTYRDGRFARCGIHDARRGIRGTG